MSNTLTQLSIQLTRFILPINIFLGVIGNSLNIIVLTRPTLYNYASTHYFLALAINNLFGSSFSLCINLLINGYQINITTFSSTSCKIVAYLNELCAVLSSYFIVLASIDRYYASSLNANRRKLSNIKIARWRIAFIVGFFAIFFLNTLIVIDIENDDRLGCRIRPKNVYYQTYPIIQVFIFDVLGPGLMIVFGILTIYNTKQLHIHPVHTTHRHRTERQLGLMLLIQVSTFIVLNLPVCIMYIMLLFLPPTFITSTFVFILIIFQFLQQFSYTTPFFLYIISGHIFRKELIWFSHRILRRRSINQVQPITFRTDANEGDGSVHIAVLTRTYDQ